MSHHGGLELQGHATQGSVQVPLPAWVQDQALAGFTQLADVPPQNLEDMVLVRLCGQQHNRQTAGLVFTCPSVEAEKVSVPVLDCSQTTL